MDCRKELSIIIPVYKTEKYLSKCLDSVLKAIDNRMEVLIINDGSPDHSEEIILRYIEENPNVFQYYKKQNGGLSDVKNYGLTKAKGDFVIFLDSDDYIEPGIYRDMLSKLIKKILMLWSAIFLWIMRTARRKSGCFVPRVNRAHYIARFLTLG